MGNVPRNLLSNISSTPLEEISDLFQYKTGLQSLAYSNFSYRLILAKDPN